jgi:hypothetical protein
MPATGSTGGVLSRAEAGGGEVAGDAGHAGGVGPVRRQVDLDDRVVEASPRRRRIADRRISPAGR